jgi:hypothetical protein
VYQILADNGIATPPHIVVSRDENNDVIGEEFVEGEDYVQSGDKIIHKPFVEKPIVRHVRIPYAWASECMRGG